MNWVRKSNVSYHVVSTNFQINKNYKKHKNYVQLALVLVKRRIAILGNKCMPKVNNLNIWKRHQNKVNNVVLVS